MVLFNFMAIHKVQMTYRSFSTKFGLWILVSSIAAVLPYQRYVTGVVVFVAADNHSQGFVALKLFAGWYQM